MNLKTSSKTRTQKEELLERIVPFSEKIINKHPVLNKPFSGVEVCPICDFGIIQYTLTPDKMFTTIKCDKKECPASWAFP